MIRTLEELLSDVGEGTDDSTLTLMENIRDTYNDLEGKASDPENWKQKYEDNDKQWREKYREAFMKPPVNEPTPETDPEPQPDKPLRFEDLFKEEK